MKNYIFKYTSHNYCNFKEHWDVLSILTKEILLAKREVVLPIKIQFSIHIGSLIPCLKIVNYLTEVGTRNENLNLFFHLAKSGMVQISLKKVTLKINILN